MEHTRLHLAFLVMAVLAPGSTAVAQVVSCFTPDPSSGWQDIGWSGQAPSQIAECDNQSLSGLMNEVVLLDAFSGGDIYRVDITGQQTMSLFSSRAPLSTFNDPGCPSCIYPVQVWANADSAWKLEKYLSRLVIWLPQGTYTFKIYLQRAAVDDSASYWGTGGGADYLVPFPAVEFFFRITSYNDYGLHPDSVGPILPLSADVEIGRVAIPLGTTQPLANVNAVLATKKNPALVRAGPNGGPPAKAEPGK